MIFDNSFRIIKYNPPIKSLHFYRDNTFVFPKLSCEKIPNLKKYFLETTNESMILFFLVALTGYFLMK